MSFPKYPAYKDSGIEWIGRIPAEWTLSRVGSCFAERRQKVSDTDYPPLSVTKNGIVPQLETAAKTDDNNNRKCVIAGDFVINSRSDRKGSSGVSPQDGSVSLINTVISPSERIYGRFCHHLFRSTAFQEEYYKYGKGIVADLWSTNYNEMKLIYLALPPLSEQQAIASFLDRECGKIDALIAEQERLIALLAEKRQAVISHAVTKGLNPNAPMKDSGVEWIGEIPVGWEVKSLRFALSDIFNGSTATQVEPSNDTIAVTRIETISGGKINLEKVGYINKEESEERKILKNGDIIFSNINSLKMIGNCAIFYGDFLLHSGMNLITLRPNSSVYPKFILYVLKSTLCREEIESRAKPAINQASISQQSICDIKIPDIPLPEQQAIASFLDRECGRIDALVEEQKAMLALCKERRAALISAAVTGKIDVRAQSKAIAA